MPNANSRRASDRLAFSPRRVEASGRARRDIAGGAGDRRQRHRGNEGNLRIRRGQTGDAMTKHSRGEYREPETKRRPGRHRSHPILPDSPEHASTQAAPLQGQRGGQPAQARARDKV